MKWNWGTRGEISIWILYFWYTSAYKKYFNGVLYECSYNDITVVQFMAFYNPFQIWNSDASNNDYDNDRMAWLHHSSIINLDDHEVRKYWRWRWMAIGAFKAHKYKNMEANLWKNISKIVNENLEQSMALNKNICSTKS